MKRKVFLIFVITLVLLLQVTPLAYAEVECGVLYQEKVYLGGFPIGITTMSEGLYVTDFADINSENGLVSPLQNKIEKGDILVSVNNYKVGSREDVAKALKPNVQNDLLLFDGDDYYNVKTTPIKDKNSSNYYLGLYLANAIDGVGTVSFVKENGTFVALGHPIADENGEIANIHSGSIYNCKIQSVTPSRPNIAGQLNGLFQKKQSIGKIESNTKFGIAGKIDNGSYAKIEILTQNRILTTLGKAKIYTTIEGETPDYYDIEIISLAMQTKAKEKGIFFKVTDPRLDKTGGIVQGMSGSPIIQNGKLVGAVTLVLVDDPTKGYGIYVDFLLE